MNVLNATKPYALCIDKMVNFMLYIGHHTQRKRKKIIHKKQTTLHPYLCLEITQKNMETWDSTALPNGFPPVWGVGSTSAPEKPSRYGNNIDQ